MKHFNLIKTVAGALAIMVMVALTACDTSSLQADIDSLKERVSALEDAVEALDAAQKSGKTITDVVTGQTGYTVIFSDGTSITLRNGLDGKNGENGANGEQGEKGEKGDKGDKGDMAVTPILRVDESGDWLVSYDGGKTFDFITDADGNHVNLQGHSGAPGTSIRVAIDDNGYYTFELYSPDSPDTVLETITTPYISNASSVLESIVEDEESGIITLTTADGTVFTFNLDVVYPTGIVVLTDMVGIEAGDTAKFEFRLNPSNARANFVVEGDDANLQLDLLGTRATADSYVTVPKNYRITKVKASTDDNDNVKVGQYTATVTDLGKSSTYNENVALVLTTKDGRGQSVQISSHPFGIRVLEEPVKSVKVGGVQAVRSDNVFHAKITYGTDVTKLATVFETAASVTSVTIKEGGSSDLSAVNYKAAPVVFEVATSDGRVKEYTVVVHYTNLPIVYISTPAPIMDKDNWIEKCTIQIWNAGDDNDIYEKAQMKGRGNSTWGYSKKPYAIKLDKKAKVLGMPKHKRWVLLANWLDNTGMRNDVSFKIAQSMSGLAWSPHGYHVDVVLNGDFIGQYYLCEQIKVDENRVDITEILPEDVDEYSKTGGYIFELDTYYDELFKFQTKYWRNIYSSSGWQGKGLPVQFKDPDEDIADEQFAYVENYFNIIEEIIINGNPYYDDVFNYIDPASFIDWWLVNELAGNIELQHPKSSYMYKDRGGKLFAGPVWDFDYDTYHLSKYKGLVNKNYMWYPYLLKDARFVALVKERWAMHKPLMEDIVNNYIQAKQAEIAESVENNKKRWTGSSNWGNADIKSALQFRINEIDSAIKAL